LPADGGQETVITPEPWADIGASVWLPDGSGLIAPANLGYFDRSQLWLFPYPAGVPRRITNDLSNYTEPVLTADGNTLLAMRRDQLAGIWLGPGTNLSEFRVLVPESRAVPGVAGLDWTPQGELVYTAFGSETSGLWAIPSQGGTPRPISRGDDPELEPAISPDGSITFSTLRDGRINVWRSDASGSNARRLTEGQFNVQGRITADGDWLVYASLETREMILYKMPLEGGDPVQILDTPLTDYVLSPDGTRLAVRFVDLSTNRYETDIRTLDGELVASPRGIPSPPTWSPDGQSLHYVDRDTPVDNLWNWPLDGSEPTQLTSFDDPDVEICAWKWSRDGEQLAVVRCSSSSDAIMFSDFR
jgi:Tol biopolymer transport system component